MNSLINIVLLTMLIPAELPAQTTTIPRLSWQKAGALPASGDQPLALGFAAPVAGVHNDVLLVGGGANFPGKMPWDGGKKKYYDDVYVYTKKKDTLLRKQYTGKLPSPVAYAAVCTTAAGIVYAGGENENGISAAVWLLGWDIAAEKITTKQLPPLPVALTNAGATAYKDKIYIAGGETAQEVSHGFFCLDMNNIAAGWQTLPPLPVPVSHMVMLTLPAGTNAVVYICGGRKKNIDAPSKLYNTVYAYSTATNRWTEKKSLPHSLMAGTGVAVGPNNMLLFGGDGGESFHASETLAATIAHTTDAELKQQLVLQKNKLQAAHPGFSKTLLLYDARQDEWISAGDMPYPAPVTTAAIPWNNTIIIPGGEIRAGVRTPLIITATLNTSGQ